MKSDKHMGKVINFMSVYKSKQKEVVDLSEYDELRNKAIAIVATRIYFLNPNIGNAVITIDTIGQELDNVIEIIEKKYSQKITNQSSAWDEITGMTLKNILTRFISNSKLS